MINTCIKTFVFILWILVLPSTHANEINHAPITITANKQHVYLQENKVIFTGNVKITQGDMSIYSDRLLVKDDAQTTQKIVKAYGSPATYFYVINGKPATAEASEITYLTGSQILKFKGNAQISQNQSVVHSPLITYNQPESEIIAETSKNKTKPVVVIFNASNTRPKKHEQVKSP